VQLRQQAITIADLAAKGSSNAQIKSLATDIASATGPSVTTMTGWLTQWNEPAPQSTAGQCPACWPHRPAATPVDDRHAVDMHGCGHSSNLTSAQQVAGTEASKGSNRRPRRWPSSDHADQGTTGEADHDHR